MKTFTDTEVTKEELITNLADGIAESLSDEYQKWWPRAFAEAIPEGANLSMVWPKFAVWLLGDEEHGVIQYAQMDEAKKVIQDVIDVYARKIAGEDISQDEWGIVSKNTELSEHTDDAESTAVECTLYTTTIYYLGDGIPTDDTVDARVAAYAHDAAARCFAYAAAGAIDDDTALIAWTIYCIIDYPEYVDEASDADIISAAKGAAAVINDDTIADITEDVADALAIYSDWLKIKNQTVKRQADKLIELLKEYK